MIFNELSLVLGYLRLCDLGCLLVCLLLRVSVSRIRPKTMRTICCESAGEEQHVEQVRMHSILEMKIKMELAEICTLKVFIWKQG